MIINNKNRTVCSAVFLFLCSFAIQAESNNLEQINQHKKVIFAAQEQDDCNKIISHMDMLNQLTQHIPSAFYYFQGRCYYKNKQYEKSLPILDDYFFHALNDSIYYNQAVKIYTGSERRKNALIQAKPFSKHTKSPLTSNKLEQIKTKTGIDFIKVEPGCFIMGSPLTEVERVDGEKQHKVCLTQPFLLGKYEITQGQWEAVMGNNPAHFKQCGSRCPIESISGEDIEAFIKIIRIKTGLQFRLPSEAEWEYAARAGTTTPFSFGENISTSQVNYDGDHPYIGKASGRDRKSPLAVGSLPANPWGFHDMHGNVWEFVGDWYSLDYYKNSLRDNPKGPDKGSFHVRRGGSWRFGARFCRSAYRGRFRQNSISTLMGFRLAFAL